jgi:predicted transposase YdaD
MLPLDDVCFPHLLSTTVWVYLLLEFQSEPDPWMALRMMVYMGLLSQHPMAEVRNLAGALFGVEQSRTLKNTLDIMRTLDAMLDDPQMKPLRRTISTWFKLSRSTHPMGICNSDRQIHRRSI